MPPVLAAGVPLSTPAAREGHAAGQLPGLAERVGAGKPVAVTVKLPAVPTVNVVLCALVIAGGLVDRQREALRRVGADAVASP